MNAAPKNSTAPDAQKHRIRKMLPYAGLLLLAGLIVAGLWPKPVPVEIAEAKTVAWCGCKHSHNPPFCDGSHSKL